MKHPIESRGPILGRGSLLALAVVLGAFAAGTAAQAQSRTVLVSPVAANPLASGTALRNALAAIPAPSSTNSWLVKVEPGIYDIGTTPLSMRSWVDLEGSGIGITKIRGSVDAIGLNAATLHGASSSELRMLTVEALAAGSTTDVIAMYNPGTSPRLYRVRFTASGRLAWGLRNASAAPKIEECEFAVTSSGGSGSVAYGIAFSAFSGLPAGRSSLLRSTISVFGGESSYGVFLGSGQILTEIRDSRLDVLSAGTTHGLFAQPIGGWQGSEGLLIRDTEISSAGGTTASYGVRIETGATISLDVTNSKIWGHVAPQTYGLANRGGSPTGIQGSSLVGFTKVAEVTGSMVISSTLLNGGPTTAAGWLGCVGVWDELAVFYPGIGCPP